MKKAIVTGAGSEIGKAVIQRLCKDGYYVYACDLEWQKQYFFTDELQKFSGQIKYVSFDLMDQEAISSTAGLITETSKIDVCINIAGKNILKPFYQWDASSLKDVFDLNFVYTTLFVKEAALKFIQHDIKGRIILISSQHGLVGNIDRIPYCVSKGMLTQLSKSLALELAPYGIRVNSVSPTFVETKDNNWLLNRPLMLHSAKSQIPLKRYARPDEIASAICFLCQEANGMITGHDLVVDGGWTIK